MEIADLVVVVVEKLKLQININKQQDKEKKKQDNTEIAKEVHEKISRLEIENGQLRKKIDFLQTKIVDLSASIDMKDEECTKKAQAISQL